MDEHPNRRRTDRGWRALVRENAYRDVWLLIITIVALYAVIKAGDASTAARRQAVDANQVATEARTIAAQNRAILSNQRAGRQFAIATSCAVESAIAEAGREVITNASPLPAPLENELERFGYPPPAVRQAAARRAAIAYVRTIAEKVVSAVGAKGGSIVRHNGTLDCKMFERLARAG